MSNDGTAAQRRAEAYGLSKVEVRSLRDGFTMDYPDSGPESASRGRLVKLLGLVDSKGKLIYKATKPIPGAPAIGTWGPADDAELEANLEERDEATRDFVTSVSEVAAKQRADKKKKADKK